MTSGIPRMQHLFGCVPMMGIFTYCATMNEGISGRWKASDTHTFADNFMVIDKQNSHKQAFPGGEQRAV
jgi:hypothetical protein